MGEEEENEKVTTLQMRVSQPKPIISEIPLKLRLDDSDKRVFESILTELRKANDTLEQILNHFIKE